MSKKIEINKAIPVDEKTQKVIWEFLGEADQDTRLVYVRKNILKGLKGKLGTACGMVGNVFSGGMFRLLKKCNHVFMSYQINEDRIEVVNMVVLGLTEKEAEKMEKLAEKAEGSLRADVFKIGKDKWTTFESE